MSEKIVVHVPIHFDRISVMIEHLNMEMRECGNVLV